MSDGLPAMGNGAVSIEIEGQSYARPSDYPDVREGIIAPGYFATFQTSVAGGREFRASDDWKGEAVAIVNESFARRFFAGANPLGRRFRRAPPAPVNPWRIVVGVVPDLLMQGIGNNDASPAGYYMPMAQSGIGGSVHIAMRTRSDEGALSSALRAAVASVDNDLAVYDLWPLAFAIRRQTWFYTVFGTFFTAFGLAALVLASAGLYGVVSFTVTQRTRELGVRSALGATRLQLLGLVMRRSAVQLAVGLALGVLLAFVASDPLRIVLFNVDPRDPVVFVAVVVALAVAGLAASFLPARRVSDIEPAIALAAE